MKTLDRNAATAILADLAATLHQFADARGLAASDYRREFDHPKYGRLRVVGFRPNAPKFPIAVEVVGDSKKLFFPVSLRDRIIAAR